MDADDGRSGAKVLPKEKELKEGEAICLAFSLRKLVMKESKRGRQNPAQIKLSAPWSDPANCPSCEGPMENAEEFVRERSRVHSEYIAQDSKTKRFGYAVCAVLIVAGGAIAVFAPETNRVLGNIIGGALAVGAAGTTGFKRLWLRSPKGQVIADSGNTLPKEKPGTGVDK